MKLKEFITNYIEPNSLIRLWHTHPSGYRCLFNISFVSMEWEVLKGESSMSDFLEKEVKGIAYISISGKSEPSAINIVIH